MYFITINLRAQEGGAARGGGGSRPAVAATHYYRQTGEGTVTSSWLKILAFTKSKARERREDLVDGHRRSASAPFGVWPRHHVWCLRFREHVKFPCNGSRRARRRDRWWRRGERRRHLTLERRRACVCHSRLEFELGHLPVDVLDRLVLRRRPIAGVSVRRVDDLAEFGRRRASRGPRGRRRWRHLRVFLIAALWALCVGSCRPRSSFRG